MRLSMTDRLTPRPGPEHVVLGRGGLRGVRGANELPAVEMPDRRLHGALGEAGIVGDIFVAHLHAPGIGRPGAPPQMEVDGEGGRRLVAPDQIAHQRVEDVVVECYCFHSYSVANYSTGCHPEPRRRRGIPRHRRGGSLAPLGMTLTRIEIDDPLDRFPPHPAEAHLI